jgi:hypothetical protein
VARPAQLPLSYIVRVYRRDQDGQIAGTVELPEFDERAPFIDFEELKAILLEPPAERLEGGAIAAARNNAESESDR